MSKWREERATECGCMVMVHEDWDRIPRFCKEHKVENDAKWYDGHATECGCAIKICRDWDKTPRFCAKHKAENDAKWYEGKATICGCTIRICRDWANIPKYCKNHKLENDARWQDGSATLCHHSTPVNKNWDRPPLLCRECRDKYPAEDAYCEFCRDKFTINSATKFSCADKGWDLPKRCKECSLSIKLIRQVFEALKEKNPRGLHLRIDKGDVVDEVGHAMTLTKEIPEGYVQLFGKEFARISIYGQWLSLNRWEARTTLL